MNDKQSTNVTHPDPRGWLSAITADHLLHTRLATPRGRLEWLFTFGDRERALSEERPLEELAREIGLFLFMVSPGAAYVAQTAFYAIIDAPTPGLARNVVRDLSTDLGDGLDAFVDGGSWTIKIERPMRRTVSRIGSDQPVAVSVWGGTNWRPMLRREHYMKNAEVWISCFLLAAADAVATEAATIRRCTGCGMLFVADDPRQEFHSSRCATGHRVAAWRAGKREQDREKRQGQDGKKRRAQRAKR